MAKYTVQIKRDNCSACGTCYSLDPDHFEGDDEGYAQLIGGKTTKVLSQATFDDDGMASAQEAADSCPEQIITVK